MRLPLQVGVFRALNFVFGSVQILVFWGIRVQGLNFKMWGLKKALFGSVTG